MNSFKIYDLLKNYSWKYVSFFYSIKQFFNSKNTFRDFFNTNNVVRIYFEKRLFFRTNLRYF